MCRICVVIVALVLLFCDGVLAQSSNIARTGSRLRITYNSRYDRLKKVEGTLIEQNRESLTLETPAFRKPLVIPRQQLVAMDISRGKQDRTLGTFIGLAAGTLVGGLVGYNQGVNGGLIEPAASAGMGILILAPAGALLGYLLVPEQWQPLTISTTIWVQSPSPSIHLTINF